MYQYVSTQLEPEGKIMWHRTDVIVDRRELLKIKVKNLADEARTIRHQEKKTQGVFRDELANHRRLVVRDAARHTQLAYGLIRGVDLRQMEANAGMISLSGQAWGQPDWAAIKKMIVKYGPKDFVFPDYFTDGVKMSKNPHLVAQKVAAKLTEQPKERRPLLQSLKRVITKSFMPQKTDAELGIKSFAPR